MLFAITIAGLAINVGAHTFGLIARAYRDAPIAERQLQLQDQWLARMRGDAWAATDVRTDGGSLTLSNANGLVTWQIDEAHRLRRSAGMDVEQWPLDATIAWSQDDAGFVLVRGDGVEIPLACPALKRPTEAGAP